ncbi:MAG: hypothetical protein WCA35_32020 [Kovacikia sp.]
MSGDETIAQSGCLLGKLPLNAGETDRASIDHFIGCPRTIADTAAADLDCN